MRSIDDLGGSLSPLNSQCVLMLLHQPKSLDEKSVRGGVFFSVIPALTGYIINGILTQGELFLDCARKILKLENEFEILNFQCLSNLQ